MNALIIGFGSIGKRHYSILSSLEEIDQCHVVSKQNLEKIKTHKNLYEVNLEDYSYIIIASKTNLHYEQLSYIENKTKNKIILVEKPLFDINKKLLIKNNKIFVAYNRRYYPIMEKIKSLILKNKPCYLINVFTGQYLPQWRPNRDYSTTYSARKNEGGGVLLDLSHELDYIQFLLGDIEILSSINTKISDLKIDSDDICTVLAKTTKNTIVNFTIDYISKEFIQTIIIHLKDISIFADLKKMDLKIVDKEKNETFYNFSEYEKNYSFIKMHKDIINNKSPICCNYQEAVTTMKKIEDIKIRNLYAK